MNVIDAIKNRKSVRAYLSDPVPKDVVEKILKAARHAPSNTNTQPWSVYVVSGKKKSTLDALLEEAFSKSGQDPLQYNYEPKRWKEPMFSRRKACGYQLYSLLGIDRADTAGRTEQWRKNYHSFGAPVVLFFFIDSNLATGSYMDSGMFIQSVMLAAQAYNISTCAQAAYCDYNSIIRSFLNIHEDKTLLCGMAMGYADNTALVNKYRTPRESVEKFTTFVDN